MGNAVVAAGRLQNTSIAPAWTGRPQGIDGEGSAPMGRKGLTVRLRSRVPENVPVTPGWNERRPPMGWKV